MAAKTFWNLRTLLLFLVLLSVTPALGLILYEASEKRKHAAGEVQENVLRLAYLASSNQERFFEGARQLLVVLAQLPAVRHKDSTACNDFFAHLLGRYPIYANFGVIDLDGTVTCSGLPLSADMNLKDRSYFQRAIRTSDFAIGDYQIGRITKKASVNFGYPVLNPAGEVQAVVFSALDLTWFNQLVADAKLPPDSSVTLIDRHGTVLARYPNPEDWVGRSGSGISIIDAILAQGEGVTEDLGEDGIPRLYAFTPLKGVPEAGYVYIGIGIPKEAAFAESNRILTRNLIGLGLVGMLALAAAWMGGDLFIIRRVNALVQATQRLSSGNLSARSGLPYQQGELGRLARAFDEMAGSLEEKTESLAFQATHDRLTELPNRALLHDRLQQAILLGQRENKPLALLLLDLNHFKEFNNTLGHRNGDLLLKLTGSRIKEALRESDTLARLDGDKFAVLLLSASGEGAVQVTCKILKALEQPFIVEGLALEVGASIGIALFPDHGKDANMLLQRADVAMYVAKDTGNDYFVYSSEQDQYNPRRLVLMGELRKAIEQDQVFLVYQPKVDLRTGTVSGVEALVRWRHPEHGVIPPDQFIMLAEHTGLIRPLTLWVLKTALSQCRTWHEEGIEIPVAVNLSMRNVQDPKLPDQIAELLQTCGVTANWLELEITESIIMADPVKALEILTRLNEMGVRISIDDFGTGYSSLGYLKKLPVHIIKVDKSFVMKMAVNNDDAVIVRSTIDLAHNLCLKVVAEGVENREIWDKLASLGCDTAQGYYMSRPLPSAEIAQWLRESSWNLEKREAAGKPLGKNKNPAL